jgi:hypothetical protein
MKRDEQRRTKRCYLFGCSPDPLLSVVKCTCGPNRPSWAVRQSPWNSEEPEGTRVSKGDKHALRCDVFRWFGANTTSSYQETIGVALEPVQGIKPASKSSQTDTLQKRDVNHRIHDRRKATTGKE